MPNTFSKIAAGTALAAAATITNPFPADACTRILYEGDDNLFIVGRSLDWKTPIPTNVYVYPQGMKKMGSNQPGAIEWTSKYGAVYAVGYDGGVTEGMNEMGLSINGLFCKGTVYDNAETMGRPPMTLAMFVAWLLDLNATTDEVVEVLKAHNFSLSGATFDGGTVSALHWGVTDATGHSVIFEFVNGNINIYDMGKYRCMTNDPDWPSMTAIVDYWEKIGGHNMLPGTVSSPDRCVRGNYFVTHVKKTADADMGAWICRTALANSCVPYTYTVEGEPNVSNTQWTSFSNLRDKRYYFQLATSNGFYYVDLSQLDLTPGQPVRKITTSEATDYVGNANKYLKKVPPFTPMY